MLNSPIIRVGKMCAIILIDVWIYDLAQQLNATNYSE